MCFAIELLFFIVSVVVDGIVFVFGIQSNTSALYHRRGLGHGWVQ
jgi:hypothetical protein